MHRAGPPFILFALSAVALASVRCGGSVKDTAAPIPELDGGSSPVCITKVPKRHRASPAACDATRPPGLNLPSSEFGECKTDADCKTGRNPRCTAPVGNGDPFCSADKCTTDEDCAGTDVCGCGTPQSYGVPAGRLPNICMPSGCRTDADCGEGGYCSPSFGVTCGAYDGLVGYFCHRPQDACTRDECLDNEDCVKKRGEKAYCGWDPAAAKWVCADLQCTG